MSNLKNLSEIEEAILRYIESRSSTHETIIKKFTSEGIDNTFVENALDELYNGRYYLTIKRYMKPGPIFFGKAITDDDSEDNYVITSLGKSYLARETANFTSFSNISNSNVAHNSSSVTQSLNISEQPQVIQEKIKELELAVIKRDTNGMKKAFAYIADKSVDLAIAILAGKIVQ